jgi:hypothetical protein
MFMKKKTIKKVLLILIIAVIAAASLFIQASADTGPKDQLTIHVKNPPAELYYLDLLTDETGSYQNFSDEFREELNQDMLALLYSQADQGWRPALTDGTNAPIFGQLTGKPSDAGMDHTFSYFGLPKTCKIIIVTQSGNVSVSAPYTRESLQSSITYDYATGKIESTPVAFSYILQFLKTCIPTLVIEGALLFLFGFKLKENFPVFLLTNIATQTVLTFTMGAAFIQEGPFSAFIVQIPVEIAILIAETLVFMKFLKGKPAGRRCAYGIAANLTSWILGTILLLFI